MITVYGALCARSLDSQPPGTFALRYILMPSWTWRKTVVCFLACLPHAAFSLTQSAYSAGGGGIPKFVLRKLHREWCTLATRPTQATYELLLLWSVSQVMVYQASIRLRIICAISSFSDIPVRSLHYCLGAGSRTACAISHSRAGA